MKHYIEVEHNENIAAYRNITGLIEQFSSFLGESCLLDEPSSCHGLRLVINPVLSDYNNTNKINDRLYWAFYEEDMTVSSKALQNFILRSLHLTLNNVDGIDKILIVLMPAQPQKKGTTKENGDQDDTDEEEESRQSFIAVKPKYTLDKVVMTEKMSNQIHRAINQVRNRKKIYEEWGFSEIDPNTKTILCFYGAPGTGKTMCAHAVASELGQPIMFASYASIESKWVGEGPKNLRKIFSDAADQNAVLFFDEADSFLSKRVNNAETGSDKHYNRMSNEMFQLLEDYDGIVIFATNLVSDFDKAFKSRILAFVEFEKPDKQGRVKLIKSMTPSKLPLTPLTESELGKLADISEGFCGREIRKAMLTSLAEGALNDVKMFSFIDLEKGFSAVKEETVAVENTMKGDNAILQDFISEHTTNGYIMDVCLKVVHQADNFSDKLKKSLFVISKVLNLEMPDLSISYKQKNLDDAVENIIENKRQTECIRYCCELLSLSSLTHNQAEDALFSIASELKLQEKTPYVDYMNALITLNNKNYA